MKDDPQGWSEVSLGDICEFKYGKNLPEEQRQGGVYEVFGSNGMVGSHHHSITDGPGIVIGRKGSFGEVHFSPRAFWPIDTTYYVDRTCTKQNLRWLMYRLSGLGLTKINRSKTIPGLNREDAYRLRLLLPPLEEQRRIAEVLDRAEALRAKRRAALAQLHILTQSIFLDLFGDSVTNVERWESFKLEEVSKTPEDIKCGPFGTQLAKSEVTTEGVPLWGIKNVNAFFELPAYEFLNEKTAKRLAQYSLEPGDIVMTRKGTVGNCAVYPWNFHRGIMHSDLLRIRVNSNVCDPIFLSHQLHFSRDVERQLSLISGGAVMPGINVTKLKTLKVFVPPISLQQKFASQVDAQKRVELTMHTSSEELDSLFGALQTRAFRGEL